MQYDCFVSLCSKPKRSYVFMHWSSSIFHPPVYSSNRWKRSEKDEAPSLTSERRRTRHTGALQIKGSTLPEMRAFEIRNIDKKKKTTRKEDCKCFIGSIILWHESLSSTLFLITEPRCSCPRQDLKGGLQKLLEVKGSSQVPNKHQSAE